MTIKPQSHLINILNSTRDHHPNFTLFLGAGASVSSGVSMAGKMIEEWRNKHHEMYGDKGEDINDHLEKYHWYNQPEEYSILFEKLYDQPTQRREYIESCITNSFPSWGYIYLVNLIREKVFNTLFTTNFDDLLNEACYQFSSDVRPIVCSHDSSINSIRITSNRPKLIKLHGDFLFDNIKNTLRELETLEKNTQDKFKQYASEFGFIFIGYSGNDRSIMDTLNTLLRFDNYFPHGIYWCVRNESKITEKVKELSRFPKFHLIKIEGFDEFFADMHNGLNLNLQEEMVNPYSALAKKLNNLIQDINLPESDLHPVIEKDIRRLGHQIQKIENSSENITSIETGLSKKNLPIPYALLSNVRTREKKYDLALEYRLKEIETDPSTNTYVQAIDLMYKANRLDLKDKLLEYIYKAPEIVKSPGSTFDLALPFIKNKEFDEADKILEYGKELTEVVNKGNWRYDFYIINKYQIIKHKDEALSDEENKELDRLNVLGDIFTKLGTAILLERYDEAEDHLYKLSKKQSIRHMYDWPLLDLLKPHIKKPELKRFIN